MKFFLIFLSLFVLGINELRANQPDLDSLRQFIVDPNTTDKAKLKHLLQIAYYSQPLEGLSFATNAAALAHKIGEKELEAIAYEYIGIKNRGLGNNLEAINASITAANIYKNIGMKNKVALIHSQLGAHFGSDKDFFNALKYFRSGLSLFLEQHDTTNINETYINFGETFRIMGELDSAEFYFNKVLINLRLHNNVNQKGFAKGNLGLVHAQKLEYDQALPELQEAITIFENTDQTLSSTVYQSEIGNIYLKMGQIKRGETILLKTYNIAKENQLKASIRDISKQLAVFYEGQQNFSQALFFRKIHDNYNDSLKNIENVRLMEQQQSRYELSTKEEEIIVLNRINRLQQMINYGLALLAIIILLFLFFLYRSNKTIRQANELVTIQKHIVEKREEEKALLLKELNHRVKNNLQMVSSLLNLQARQLKGHPAAEALIAGRYRVEALTLIHQKLYRDDVDTTINIRSYIEELAYNLVHNFGQQTELTLSLIQQDVNIEKAIPLGLIINELVTNALKYGSPKASGDQPKLTISMAKKGLELIIKVVDNGPGLPADFNWKNSNSFGLKLVHSLVNQLSGKIDYTATPLSQWQITLNIEKIT